MCTYHDDLAYVHDVGFNFYAEGMAPGVLQTLHEAGIDDGLVIDLGCGSGIWAGKLVEAGHQVLGVDLSPGMLRIARRRAPRAKFVAESFVEFRPPRCRAVTALGEIFNYLSDPKNGAATLRRVCQRIYHALQPGGVLVFDVAEPARGKSAAIGFRSGGDWACAHETTYDARRKILTRHIITFRKSGKHYRRHEETHRLRLYRRQDVARMLRDIGFRVRTTRRFGDFELLPGMAAFIARKA